QAEDGIRDFHVTGVQTCALPIYAPVETPLKRPSVITGTCLPHARYFSAEVSWYVSSIPVPRGPMPIKTITSPGPTGASVKPFTAATASFSLVKTREVPRLR